ncbi:glycine betaine/proline transport system substrate-binding protein [Evansella caseinilytica]|uniref:Glycine betaine/proline transport system substrate-binding protein n=1 Tax=Evansella caseinilytica TaxID=1503961 RepID=A0A1H3QGU0_9BACI|nr:glycine betaine ABC transporter substrate-binding protein [Evansella caseinilytica]SDZ12587.1 glycine betaine/proline transport system substrate-binding protein [Evansella caseinilytica]
MKLKKLGFAAGLSIAMLAAGCGADEEDAATPTGGNGGSDDGTTEQGTGDVGEALNFTITGIEPGAGIMTAAENAIDVYGLDGWSVSASSSAAMTQQLATAYESEEPIIVTGWTPHWKFAAFDLKYLDDPEGVFGAEEVIQTFARQGLEEDHPTAYTVLDNFHWTADEMGEIMIDINDGADPAEAAAAWVDANAERVAEWTDGVEPVDGDALELVYVAWDSEIASTHMIGKVLEDLGYNVTLTPTEATYMFEAVANGSADATVAAWLPETHAHFLEDFGDDMVDLGVNLEGAKIGLVVPSYMDITSIEDLK